MKRHTNIERKLRTRLLIQSGGLLHKAGLLEAFLIKVGDDLQAPECLQKSAQLVGFLRTCFEETRFDEESFEKWKERGERLLRYE